MYFLFFITKVSYCYNNFIFNEFKKVQKEMVGTGGGV